MRLPGRFCLCAGAYYLQSESENSGWEYQSLDTFLVPRFNCGNEVFLECWPKDFLENVIQRGERGILSPYISPVVEILMDGSKALLAMLCAITFAACSNSIELSSKAVEQPMRIDADDIEWRDNAVLVDDGRFSLGFQNDSADLFIYVKTMDRTLERQIMMSGLTIWMDSTGGDANYFGIRFPLSGERLQESSGPTLNPSAREGGIERSIAEIVPDVKSWAQKRLTGNVFHWVPLRGLMAG